MNLEIERRWLLHKLPETHIVPLMTIRQYYLDPQTRIRVTEDPNGSNITLCRKVGTGLVREELEFEISEVIASKLLELPCKRIVKNRCAIPFMDNTKMLTLDIYEKELSGLFIVEYEFPTVEEAQAFSLPLVVEESVTKEVTTDLSYSNYNMACKAAHDSPRI